MSYSNLAIVFSPTLRIEQKLCFTLLANGLSVLDSHELRDCCEWLKNRPPEARAVAIDDANASLSDLQHAHTELIVKHEYLVISNQQLLERLRNEMMAVHDLLCTIARFSAHPPADSASSLSQTAASSFECVPMMAIGQRTGTVLRLADATDRRCSRSVQNIVVELGEASCSGGFGVGRRDETTPHDASGSIDGRAVGRAGGDSQLSSVDQASADTAAPPSDGHAAEETADPDSLYRHLIELQEQETQLRQETERLCAQLNEERARKVRVQVGAALCR